MITIAICDSEESSRNQLQAYCRRLRDELHLPIASRAYASGEDLLAQMSPNVDIVLLESQLAGMSGMETARRIRANNTAVMLIFITAQLSCAVESYRIQATDFIPKPASYREVSQALTEAIQKLEKDRGDYVTFRTPAQWVRLPMHSILYVESARNKAVIHTVLTQYELYISMKEVEARLDPERFFRCHSGYIINLSNIVRVDGFTAMTIDGALVDISKHRKKEFLERFARFTGEEMV